MNNIGIFSFARTNSQRCPNKMLRPFAGTTLTDIVLAKLKALGENTFFSGYEDVFKNKCDNAGVEFIRRSKRSSCIDAPITEILSFLKDVNYEHLLIVNPCLPFLKVETIEAFLKQCIRHHLQPAFSVIKKNNFFFGIERRPLNFRLSMKTINTKAAKPVYEFAHALYFFNKDYFFSHGRYWDWKKVCLVELKNKFEALDIDTEEDFLIAEKVWSVK